MVLQLVMFSFFFLMSNTYYTGFASLDSYSQNDRAGYFILNLTFLEIFENSLLLGSFYVLRNYPSEFVVKQEFLYSFLCNFFFSILTEGTFNNRGFGGHTVKCFLGTYSAPYAVNLMRAASVILFLHFVSRKCFFYFPLPFAWIFKDLSKFIFEPYCIRIFEAYLQKMEPNKLQHYEKIMEGYLGRSDEMIGEQAHDFSINNDDIGDNIDKLSKSFDNFKKTVSYYTIHWMVKQFEEINRRIDR